METKDVIAKLRIQNNMTQEDLDEKVFVTRQAISRQETGETTPNIEALKTAFCSFQCINKHSFRFREKVNMPMLWNGT